jgi:hypothetical protein
MGDESGISSAVGNGLGLLMNVAIAGAVLKGVSNIANEVGTAGNKKKGFEGIKPMKMMKVKTPKVPKMPEVKRIQKAAALESGFKFPKKYPLEAGKSQISTEMKRFVPKRIVPKEFKAPKMMAFKPFKLTKF